MELTGIWTGARAPAVGMNCWEAERKKDLGVPGDAGKWWSALRPPPLAGGKESELSGRPGIWPFGKFPGTGVSRWGKIALETRLKRAGPCCFSCFVRQALGSAEGSPFSPPEPGTLLLLFN